jgi:nucleoside-diphosphate-sugar epimerase
MRFLVTGGAGFIGSEFARHTFARPPIPLLSPTRWRVVRPSSISPPKRTSIAIKAGEHHQAYYAQNYADRAVFAR